MDWNHTATLLHIADKANQWPQLHWVRDKAIEELSKLKEDIQKTHGKLEAKPEPVKLEVKPEPDKVEPTKVEKSESFAALKDKFHKSSETD